MRFFNILAIAGILLAFTPGQAQALDWPWEWHWKWPWDWFDEEADPTFGSFQPYLEDPKTPHNVQWRDDPWVPQDWIAEKGSAKEVMDGLYRAQIVTGQFSDGDVPVLEVGQGFMDLSGRDKRRVVAFVDHAFGVTENSPSGAFYIYHIADDDKPIGVYDRDGLQLQ